MTIPIKQIILEGSINQVIEEMAVHANHPNLNKKLASYENRTSQIPVFSKTLNSDVMVSQTGKFPNNVLQNRNDFAKTLSGLRKAASFSKQDKHNMYGHQYAIDHGINRDNYSRLLSQTGARNEKELTEKVLDNSSIGPFLKVAGLPKILTASPRNVPITKSGIQNQYDEANALGLTKQ